MTREVALIAALDRGHAIGADNRLPWHLPDDLRRFKALTTGKTVLMGRKTAESLGRALPGRRNLVLTRRERAPYEGMDVVPSIDAALAAAPDELWVIGGGEVYAQTLPLATALYLTWVACDLAVADAWFPPIDPARWREVGRVEHAADERHAHAFRFVDYRLR